MSADRVLIVTGQHFAAAPRKVDLHFMADALRGQGIAVDFLTWRLSPASRFVRDGRHAFALGRARNRWTMTVAGIEEFIWMAPIHPLNLRKAWLNALTAPLFRRIGALLPRAVLRRLPTYSHILVESGPSPLLAPVMRHHAPDARFIYHAADRLATIDVHPCITEVLAETIGLYDTIHIMAEAMRGDFPADAPVFYLPHGISRELFDACDASPYIRPRNAVSVGDMLFDAEAIATLAAGFPDWQFHLFGRRAVLADPPANIVLHGERPFSEIVPFVKFADIGLAPYRSGPGADYLSQSSLKMIQYSYCRLPIVAPEFAAAGRAHVLGYRPGDKDSITRAFADAAAYDRDRIDPSGIRDWREVVGTLFGNEVARHG